MANNPENVLWESGVYQFETTDPIQGGAGGIDNLPHVQLGGRTLFLKARQDAIASQAGLTPSDSDQVQGVACTVLHVQTIPALRACPVPAISNARIAMVITAGGATLGDGLGGTYRWSFNSTAADDGFNVVRPNTNPASGRWLLILPNPAGLNANLLNGQAASYYLNASNLNAGTVPTARLGSGAANTTTYLRGDQVWSTVNAVSLNGQAAAFYQNASNINAGTLATARMGSGAPDSSNYLRGDGVWAAVNASTLGGQSSAYFLNASNLNAGTVPTARLGSGTANGSTFLRGDNVWSQVDAALLNGLSASHFLNASNLNAGAISASLVPLNAVSQHQGNLKTRNFPGKVGTNVTLAAGSGPPSISGSNDGDVWEYY